MDKSAADVAVAEPAPRRRNWWLRNPLAALAAMVLLLVVFIAIFAGVLSPHDPVNGNILDNLLPPLSTSFDGELYVLGTDAAGRDVLSVILYGTRISLTVGIVSVLGAGLIGTAVGVVAGYFGGAVDEVAMRLVDVQLAFPFILLAIIIMFVLGQGFANVVVVLIVTTWPMYARIARAEALRLRGAEYVLAARTMGAGSGRIILRHIVPNAATPLIVVASAAVPQMIILEAALSFLGVGMPPNVASWGGLLAAGRDYLSQAWWVATFPGLAIMLTVLSVNILGDALRDYLDPSLADK
ncbi:ABC transporter permease [Aquibium sp. A9E412]|uniref:ABC transporter permease n=1 Tax=Aquibium sp. A9E412 TaxID=2976767 RepID=UPI0025AEFDD2|nr:ABC transporter permease [Aquibium sp. A9E412]MDN2567026.1 ABC transporter permease [Aquibium sp. A9E412]